MRYTRSLGEVFLNGSKSIVSQAIRQQLSPPVEIQQHSEYPIFLMHGFMGFTALKFFDVKLLEHFNGVKASLQQVGYRVFNDEVVATECAQTRALMWSRHLEKALRTSGAKKVHIIAHGQGAIDARILACSANSICNNVQGKKLQGLGLSNKIASITSLGGPHLGTPVADHIETKASKAILTDLLDYIAIINACKPLKVKHCVENLSRDYMTKIFNPAMQIPNTIPCFMAAANPINSQHMGFLFNRTWKQINETAEYDGGGSNDGLVPVRSALFEGNETLLAGTQQKQWHSLGQVSTDHLGLIGTSTENPINFSYLPLFIGLAQNIDSGYRINTKMALQTNGNWQRSSQVISLTSALPLGSPKRDAKSRKAKETA